VFGGNRVVSGGEEGGLEGEGTAEPGTEECVAVDSIHGDWGVMG